MLNTNRMNIDFIRKLSLITLVFTSLSASAINPVNIVYRVDNRPPEEITLAGGMFPYFNLLHSNDLLEHFTGEAPMGYTSGFVSTTSLLEHAIDHSIFEFDIDDEGLYIDNFETYLYAIRPADNFYNVDESISHARDASPQNAYQYTMLRDALEEWGGMEEWVAYGGFAHTRIIAYAPINAALLNQYYQSGAMNSDVFWATRWHSNPSYSPQFDHDQSSSIPYPTVGTPNGFIIMAQNEAGQQLPLPVVTGTACNDSQNINHLIMKRESFAKSTCLNEKFSTIKYFYNKKALASILLLLTLN
ncbi:enterotoxin A family protein [Yersinia rochesterensis]|uniref:enterotoxin A family protein n=1 Tax=Yersinia rochesterensis TaxID=1604335 RepID=UPI002852FE37|nr:enterotoxin A family protein [Yersinia rochesterensis]MDR5018336.1 enterotoxin A family protein [Yersinia rochesterensis]